MNTIIELFENEYGRVEKEGDFYCVYEGSTYKGKFDFFGSSAYVYDANDQRVGLLSNSGYVIDVKECGRMFTGGFLGSIEISGGEITATEIPSGNTVSPGELLRQLI